MKRRRLALGIAVALAVGAAWAYRLATRSPPADLAPHPFNQDRNAVWLEHRWLERHHDPLEMDALFERLAARGVLYVYPHIIPITSAGELPPHDREQMRAFLSTARRVAPAMKVLPWVGGLRVGYKRMRPGTVDLSDLTQRQRMVAECRGLVDEGFDGIHVNIEPVDNGNVEFLSLLHALRTAVGPDRILSISATRPGPLSLPMARNFVWTADYYRRLGGVVDQLVVMAYDTALPTAALYQRYVSYAALSTTSTLARHGEVRVLLGVPTYDETGLMHRAGVETLGNALQGVIRGLRGSDTGGTFEGIALYAEWTTEDGEWSEYERVWRGGGGRAAPGHEGVVERILR